MFNSRFSFSIFTISKYSTGYKNQTIAVWNAKSGVTHALFELFLKCCSHWMFPRLFHLPCIYGAFNIKWHYFYAFIFADLSKNRLTDFAADICHFVALETLNLYHNCIKTIPDSIISLQSLTSLNIRCTHARFHGLVSGLKVMIPKPHQLSTTVVWHGGRRCCYWILLYFLSTPRLINHLQFKSAAP